jgi:hypothetical protein
LGNQPEERSDCRQSLFNGAINKGEANSSVAIADGNSCPEETIARKLPKIGDCA